MLLKHFGTISRNLLSRKEMLAEVQVFGCVSTGFSGNPL